MTRSRWTRLALWAYLYAAVAIAGIVAAGIVWLR